MLKKRINTFETNSSSTHALSVGTELHENYVPYGKNLKIRWIDTDDERVLSTLTDKVSYLVSHIASWYKYNAIDYDDLIEQIKDDTSFRMIEEYVKHRYNKEIVFPKEYDGDIEDIVNINHQLTSWNHNINEVLEDIVNEDRDYLAEVLEDGKFIEFGRD